jgi:phosphotransferase system HPr-like phosphotransfer protein
VAFYTYTFTHYSNPSGTSTVLSNVTSHSIRGGKSNLLDPLQPTTAQINGRNPAGLPTIKVGDIVDITSSGIGFGGFVSNFQVYYGKDPDEDTWTISLEDAIAYLGRATVTVSWSAGVTTRSAAIDVATAAGIDFSGSITDTSKSTVSAQSFTNVNALEVYRTLAITEQARVIAGYSLPGFFPTLNFLGRNVLTTGGRFNDGSSTALVNTDWRYESLDFAALADNYAQKIIVEPAGLAAQTAGSGTRVYTLQTYDQTTAQAAQLAQYVDTVLSGQTAGPERVAVIMEAQVSPTFPSDVTTILLRSNTYTANVLGRDVQADPTATRVAWSLAPGATTNWLVLDDATLGTLDYNRLGF